MLVHIYEIIYDIVYISLYRLFVGRFVRKKQDTVNDKLLRLLYLPIWLILLYVLSDWLEYKMIIKIISIIMVDVLFSCVEYKTKIQKIVILTVIYTGICFASDWLIYLCMDGFELMSQVDTMSDTIVSLVPGTTSQMLVLVIVVMCCNKNQYDDNDVMGNHVWSKFLVVPIITVVVSIVMFMSYSDNLTSEQNNMLVLVAVSMLIINIYGFYMIRGVLISEEKSQRNRLLLEKAEHTEQLYHYMTDSYEKQRKREHEFKNQIMTLNALVEHADYDKAKEFMRQYTEDTETSIDCIDTNNITINSVINIKYADARKHGIIFVVKTNDLKDIPVADRDMVVILANMLDNAIEASCKLPEDMRYIRLKLKKEKDMILLSVANGFDGKLRREGEVFFTSKEDKEIHGIGIQNIRDMVDKYEGECMVRIIENEFRMIISIPL